MSMRCLKSIGPAVLLVWCLWLPAAAEAGYDTAFLTLMPPAGTPPFTWTLSEAVPVPAPVKHEPALRDPDETPQNALIEKASSPPVSLPSFDPGAWNTYIDHVIVPSLRATLASRLTQPILPPTLSRGVPPTAFEDDNGQPVPSQVSSPEPFIEIVIPLGAKAPNPPTIMHVQLLVPEKTILRILQEATEAVQSSAGEPGFSSATDRVQHSKTYQAYLDNVSETLKDEATVQKYFRSASTTSSLLSVMSTFGQIIALGTLPLHALFTTIPMIIYYAVNAALGEDPLNLNWKIFSSTSNSLLRTSFSDTLIPVP